MPHQTAAEESALERVVIDHSQLDAARRTFDDLGYVIVENALDQAKIDELLATIEQMHMELEGHEHANKNRNGLNIRPVVDKHPAFLDLLIWPTTFALVARLLNHYSIQLQQSNLIEARPSRERRLTGWHSDGGVPTIGVDGVRAFGSLKVGYFLRDLTERDMGALMLVPGSHRQRGAPPFLPDARDPAGAQEICVSAGDAVVFQQGVWHASAPNYSDQTRVALYYGYSYRVLRPVDYAHMPEDVLARCSPVQRQLLGETVTHQGYYVPTPADTPLRDWYVEQFGEPRDRGELDRVADLAVTTTS